jgi:hypothetical protein
MKRFPRTVTATILLGMISCEKMEEANPQVREKTAPPNEEYQALLTFREDTRQHYKNRRFAELEKIANELRTGKERLSDGEWKICQFYESLQCREDEAESIWQLHGEIHRAWQKEFPESITARVAYAYFLAAYAWHARSDEYASEVTEEGWRLFGERLAEARTVLDQSKALSPACPVWWFVCQRVALGQGWPSADYDSLFKEAKAFEPDFHPYDLSRAKYLLPRWHGQPGEWAKDASDRIPLQGESGAAIYARVVCEMETYEDDVFGKSGASWSQTRKGFEDLRAAYPASKSILNTYCRIACLAGDKEMAKKLFAEIGESRERGIWYKGEFSQAKEWAMSEN